MNNDQGTGRAAGNLRVARLPLSGWSLLPFRLDRLM